MSKYNRGAKSGGQKRARESDEENSDAPVVDPDVDAIFKAQLSATRRVKVSKYKSMLLCDIREMYERAGVMMPTAKGS